MYAEFIIKTALEIESEKLRDEWADYDLKTKDGIKVEVKSSAYIQSWKQSKFSNISFSIKAGRSYDYKTKTYKSEANRAADVYVFCVLKHKYLKTVDPLNMNQWEFYIVSTKILDKQFPTQKTMALSVLQKIAEAVPYDEIKERVLNFATD